MDRGAKGLQLPEVVVHVDVVRACANQAPPPPLQLLPRETSHIVSSGTDIPPSTTTLHHPRTHALHQRHASMKHN